MIRFIVSRRPPVRTPERLATIVDAATEVFGRAGFARAQMADIATAAGVSVGTLYNYVEGKEALLLLCAEHPFGAVAKPRPLPVPVLDRGALIHAVESTLVGRGPGAGARGALWPPTSDPSGPSSCRHRRRSCSTCWPGPAALRMRWSAAPGGAGPRRALLPRAYGAGCSTELGTYSGGSVTSPGCAGPSAARFVVEVTTWWARHRHHDPEPPAVDDAGARG